MIFTQNETIAFRQTQNMPPFFEDGGISWDQPAVWDGFDY